MSQPPRKETISSRISALLRESILRGDLAPGAKINLDRLRAAHDVSISPLREAVSRLVSDGLVEFEDQRGYRVTPVSLDNLAEVTRLRTELEALALDASIQTGDLEWESDVMRALYRLNRTERDGTRPETIEAWEAAHTDFHLSLIRGCNMPLLLHFCTILHNMNDRYRRLYLARSPSGRDVQAEHEAIAHAATSRRLDEARDLLRAHIARTGQNLQAQLGSALPADRKIWQDEH
ncbi:MAG: GntR family transcriptional regulator [Paracoccaceae bacterium]|nr:GntR family transcriptional regulator [Paracoccaceae bacterium]